MSGYYTYLEIANNLVIKMQAKTGNMSRREDPEDFLKILIRDYNYLCSQ